MTKILFFGGDRLKENTPLSALAQYFFKKKVAPNKKGNRKEEEKINRKE